MKRAKSPQHSPHELALLKAVLERNATNVSAYLKRGVDLDTPWMAEVLVRAAQHGFYEGVKELLEAGANPNSVTEDTGITPLMWAARFGNTDVVELLIERGADLELRSCGKFGSGLNALMYAAKEGRTETAELLIRYGADVNAFSEGGTTPLLWAAHDGHLETARFLLAAGADANAVYDTNVTALRWAQKYGHSAVAELLKSAGAKELPLSPRLRLLDKIGAFILGRTLNRPNPNKK